MGKCFPPIRVQCCVFNIKHLYVNRAFRSISNKNLFFGFLKRFDTVKTRMQCTPPGTYRSAYDVLKKVVKNEVSLLQSFQHVLS